MVITTGTSNKTRSPNYPAIGLEDALVRLKDIYDKQRTYASTREVVAKLMGYGGLNGASATVISALSKYGLLEGHGDNLRVSDMGQDLMLHRKGDPEYTAALRTAASMPAFFRELREQYPDGLPHEHSLRASLIKRGFNAKSIDAAVRAFRDTLEFVDAEIGDSVASAENEGGPLEEGQGSTGKQQGSNPPPSPPKDPLQKSIQLPLSVSEWATLYAPFPLTESAWGQMLAVLNAMKPALVAPASQPSVEVSQDAVDGEEDEGAGLEHPAGSQCPFGS